MTNIDTGIEDLLARLREQYDRLGITTLREAAQAIELLRNDCTSLRAAACKKYNGWANRATWNVALWADNDWSTELDEWRRDKHITDGASLRAAFESFIVEMVLLSYMLQPLSNCEPSQFFTPDGDSFEDADWDELFEYLIAEPRKELQDDDTVDE